MAHRQSTFSNASGHLLAGGLNPTGAPTTTSALISALHGSFQTNSPYQIDASTSLVVVNALAGGNGGGGTMMTGISTPGHEVIDSTIPLRAWEHARRRAEDQCILVGSISPASTPSLLVPLLQNFPEVSPKLLSVLNTVRPFLVALTPYSPQTPLHHGLVVTQNISLTGHATGCSIALTPKGIDVQKGLLSIPAQAGYRAFDVFYYLLSSTSSPQEREYLSLEQPDKYDLLRRSGTYSPPAWHPTADDAASAEDFRQGLREIGIKGSMLRGVLSVLAGLLKLGNTISVLTADEEVEELCEDIGGLLGVEPEVLVKIGADERSRFIGVAYQSLVNWIITKANAAMEADFVSKRQQEGSSAGSEGDTVSVSFMEIADEAQAKAICMRLVFDDEMGINAEMKEDGVEVAPANSAVLREMKQAIEAYEGDAATKREEEYERDREMGVVEKIGREVEQAGFLKQILFPEEHDVKIEKLEVNNVLATSRVWHHIALSPTDPGAAQNVTSTTSMSMTSNTSAGWSAAAVSKQVRSWRLMEWGNRRNRHLDFTADFDFMEFSQRYAPLGCQNGRDGVESWVLERGWSNGEVVVGRDRVWMREGCWWEVELMLDVKPDVGGIMGGGFVDTPGTFATPMNVNGSGFFPPMPDGSQQGSRDNLLRGQPSPAGFINRPMSVAQPFGDSGLIHDKAFDKFNPNALKDAEIGSKAVVREENRTFGRKVWVGFVWALTFWIPSFLLKLIGRMKRPDVRLAWREKFVIFSSIVLVNAILAFFLIGLGMFLCPDKETAWDSKFVSFQAANPHYWASIRGNIYDFTKFYKLQHSDIDRESTPREMKALAGKDLTPFFPIPLSIGCPGLVSDDNMYLMHNDTAFQMDGGYVHVSGPSQPNVKSKLRSVNWYKNNFAPRIKEYYKGTLIWKKKYIQDEGENNNVAWFMLDGNVYDLTDYFYTLKRIPSSNAPGARNYDFLAKRLTTAVKQNPGQDLSADFSSYFNNKAQRQNNLNCLKNTFYIGKVDFTGSARCQAQPIILLAMAVVLCTVIGVKFLAALQLGTKRRPAMQDKFVICQIPCYTEGEDSLRKSLDSLTALDYENKRKLIFVICDGMVVGGGNDKSTPQIVLDILGVDPKVDPPALPFKSVGEGSQQLNYGKVYSGLYEFEGRVVPYVVVVKVGKPTETAKPGNRGKRDSQIILMSFLNRVHHRSPMNPLELELFHQINNVIGVDPELYEYLLMVDADTQVREDSLNRLVASCANNSKIAGICGETNLENEGRSWWTMIQVYEYYISHHLAKSFESLFGSVTCLPGCFSMYRLRTADKGKPLIISSKVIDEYSDGVVDTLHKKNLLSLGEDRFLTTLMTKHFPQMSYKFVPDAYAATAAPESWSVLLSQRRRWINSTVHNLIELMFLKDMCGFCLFSMRFVVFIDLIGTILLPVTVVYIGYLIYIIATPGHPFPIVSIGMLAAVYGLQAVIFIIKRQWQHVGWMIIYLLAIPIYSFILPLYSFWKQDDFSWGNTRIVVGEAGDKKLVATEDEPFDPASIPLQTWDEYATMNNLPGRRGGPIEKQYEDNGGYEMDDMQSVYSSAKPASTIHLGANPYLAPIPSPLGNRQSSYSTLLQNTSGVGFQDGNRSHLSVAPTGGDYWQEGGAGGRNSVSPMSTPGGRLSRSPLGGPGYASSRPASSVMDFQRALNGPDNATIAEVIRECLTSVDLDTVTKKQVRALVEQRLQTELTGERRQFMDKQIDIELANM